MTVEGQDNPARSPNVVRDLAIGVVSIAFILWITFFSTAGFVEIAMLGLAVALLIWFSTVDTERLIDPPNRPSLMLFFLATVGMALMLTGALIIQTATLLFATGVGFVSVAIGLVRALSHRYHSPNRGVDGVL